MSVTFEELAAEAKLAQLSRPLLSEEKVKEIWQVLDGRHRLEFLLDLWRASLAAIEANDFMPLVKLLADWEATAEILADRDLAQTIREEREASGEEKGRSWEAIRQVVPHL